MSDRDAKYRAKYVEALQPHVADPIRAVGVFSRPGSLAMAGMMQLSPAAGYAMEDRSSGLPRNVVMAVTDRSVHVFDFRPKGFNIKVKKEVATWSREGLVVTKGSGGMLATRVAFDWPGAHVELDSNIGGGGFNEELTGLLAGPAGAG